MGKVQFTCHFIVLVSETWWCPTKDPHLNDSVFWKITKTLNKAAIMKYHIKLSMILCKCRQKVGTFTLAIKSLCIMDEEYT